MLLCECYCKGEIIGEVCVRQRPSFTKARWLFTMILFRRESSAFLKIRCDVADRTLWR